jgi:hypothetical protein
MAPAFLEFWNVVLHPPQNRRVHKDHSALSHHFHQVTCTQLVPQIPANAQNDNLLIELPSLEQSLNLSRRCHARDYPTLGKEVLQLLKCG